MGKKSVIIGNKYNKLTVIQEIPHKSGWGVHRRYLCQCECGKFREVQSNHLNSGSVKSCGCLVDGLHDTYKYPLYRIYKGIKKRCYNTNDSNYKYYGGKGIKLCDEWLVYKNFKEWALSNGYKYLENSTRMDRLSIDRIDSTKNYEPTNCRWIPFRENLARSKK